MPNPPDDLTTPIDGPYGTARNVTAAVEAVATSPHASVAVFRLECPGQSPAWSSYMLAVYHLRPVEGLRAPTITEESATHELLLVALDPDRSAGPPPWPWMTPINAVVQVDLGGGPTL